MHYINCIDNTVAIHIGSPALCAPEFGKADGMAKGYQCVKHVDLAIAVYITESVAAIVVVHVLGGSNSLIRIAAGNDKSRIACKQLVHIGSRSNIICEVDVNTRIIRGYLEVRKRDDVRDDVVGTACIRKNQTVGFLILDFTVCVFLRIPCNIAE